MTDIPTTNVPLLIKKYKEKIAANRETVSEENDITVPKPYDGMDEDEKKYTEHYKTLLKILPNKDPRARYFDDNHIQQCVRFVEASKDILMKRYPEIKAYPDEVDVYLLNIINLIKSTKKNLMSEAFRTSFQTEGGMREAGMRHIDYIRKHFIEHLYFSVTHHTFLKAMKRNNQTKISTVSSCRNRGVIIGNNETMHPLLKRIEEIFPPDKKNAIKFHIEPIARVAKYIDHKDEDKHERVNQEFLTHTRSFANKKSLSDYLEKTFIPKLKRNISGLSELASEECIHELPGNKFIIAIPLSAFPNELRLTTKSDRGTYIKKATENTDAKQTCNFPPASKDEYKGLIYDDRHKKLVSKISRTLAEFQQNLDMKEPNSYKAVFLKNLSKSFIKLSFYNAARKTIVQASRDHANHLNTTYSTPISTTRKTPSEAENDKWSYLIARFAIHLWEYHETAPRTPQSSTTTTDALDNSGKETMRRSNSL